MFICEIRAQNANTTYHRLLKCYFVLFMLDVYNLLQNSREIIYYVSLCISNIISMFPYVSFPAILSNNMRTVNGSVSQNSVW